MSNTHFDTFFPNDLFKFLVYFVCYEADAYISLYPSFRKVDIGLMSKEPLEILNARSTTHSPRNLLYPRLLTWLLIR